MYVMIGLWFDPAIAALQGRLHIKNIVFHMHFIGHKLYSILVGVE